MPFLGTMVNPSVAPEQDFTPLPAGDYPVVIIDSDLQPTKRNDGQFLKLTYQVIDGPAKGRHVFERLNLENPNAQAVEIAQRSLNAIIQSVGLAPTAVTDSVQLHNRPLVIRVEYREGQGTYGPSNEVKAHKHLDTAAQPAPTAPAPQQYAAAAQPATPQPAAAPPWAARPAA